MHCDLWKELTNLRESTAENIHYISSLFRVLLHLALATVARKASDFLPVLLDAFPPILRHSRVT